MTDNAERPEASIADLGEVRRRLGTRTAGVRFELQNGERVDLVVGDERQERDRLERMLRRIGEALEVHRRVAGETGATALTRGPRTIPAWIQSLRGLGLGAHASHRVAAVSTERLLRIALAELETRAATPPSRA